MKKTGHHSAFVIFYCSHVRALTHVTNQVNKSTFEVRLMGLALGALSKEEIGEELTLQRVSSEPLFEALDAIR